MIKMNDDMVYYWANLSMNMSNTCFGMKTLWLLNSYAHELSNVNDIKLKYIDKCINYKRKGE